jgi:deoxyribose-phosphate aldolase
VVLTVIIALMESLNKYIDHTLLKPEATSEQIQKLCEEALTHEFATVCVNPGHVQEAAELLEGSSTGVCTVIGFPLGATLSSVKAFEARMAIDQGAKEIDMVINVGSIKDKDWSKVENDIHAVVEAASGRLVKVILETCLLTDEEIVKACQLAVQAKAHYVKTSTGFSTGGATPEAVKLMKETVGDDCKVKASGGIRDKEAALKMIELGAERLGTSSGIAIIQGSSGRESY